MGRIRIWVMASAKLWRIFEVDSIVWWSTSLTFVHLDFIFYFLFKKKKMIWNNSKSLEFLMFFFCEGMNINIFLTHIIIKNV